MSTPRDSFSSAGRRSHCFSFPAARVRWACVLLVGLSVLLPPVACAGVRIHGEAGTFGRILEPLRTRTPFATSVLPDLAFLPGKSAFFTAATSDGTIFAAGFHQNTENLVPTGCWVNVICINPDAATCWDEGVGEARHFANILVKTRDGATTDPRDEARCSEPSSSFAFRSYGVDISDIETVVDEQGEEHVAFVSSLASLGNYGPSGFPMLGFLSKIDGAWRLDEARQHWLRDIAQSSPEALVACPGDDCGGVSEIAFLPRSRRLAVGVYFPRRQGLLILSLDGEVLAHRRIPYPGNRCTSDPTDVIPWLGVRQVDVDPTSTLGDERIAITVDGFAPFDHPIQELRYDEASRSLVPTTNLVVTTGGGEAPPDCTPRGQNANYDRLGNLVVGALVQGRATYNVYVKDPATGVRSIETRCPFTGDSEDEIGRPCAADLSVGEIAGFDKKAGPRLGFTHHNANTLSAPGSSVLARVNFDGTVNLLDLVRANDLPVYVSYQRLGLDVHRLPRGDRVKGLVVWKGALRESAKTLWVPVATTLQTAAPGCSGGVFCEVWVNERRPSWLYEIDYASVLDGALRATGVAVTGSAIARSANERIKFVVRTNRNDSVYRQRSGFWLYPKDSDVPVLQERVQRGVCEGGTCEYKAEFRQRKLRRVTPGRYRWTLALTLKGAPDVLHAQGVIDVR